MAATIGFNKARVYTNEMPYYIGFPVALFILFPFCLMKKMSSFRYASLLSLLAILYILIVLVVELPDYIGQNYYYERVNFASFNMNIFSSCAITFFAFSCHIEAL